MAFGIFTEPEPESTPRDLRPFPHKTKYIQAVDYYNPDVRNYAVSLTADDSLKKYITDYHEYRRLIQCFAVFRDINKRWNYVNDPLGQEYLVKASDNLGVFSGDCDDHSIMMAAAVMSIGGTMRLVHTTEHVYPRGVPALWWRWSNILLFRLFRRVSGPHGFLVGCLRKPQ